ncbi:MAG: DUF2505 family protein [Sandaracinaceae bacterium]|nr:DUF2505 family protein [Sandaracinaceae bacterium]
MSARLHDERRFDVPPERLVALWKDGDFQLARSAHLGTLEARCAVDGDTVVLEETRDTGWKPHVYVTRLTTRWEGLRAEWTLERLAGPGEASASGTVVVSPAASGSRFVFDGTLEVRVPVLGRLIERVARRALIAEKDREAAFVAGWIRSITGT